jgi:hypothetical protein
MKTQLSTFAFALITLVAAAYTSPTGVKPAPETTISQPQAAGFAFFRTHRQGKGITASWGMTANSGVSGFTVKKTYEDPSDPYAEWQTVAAGQCDGSRSYKCTDANVSPGFVNYKVVAELSDGSTVESDISTVHIVSH